MLACDAFRRQKPALLKIILPKSFPELVPQERLPSLQYCAPLGAKYFEEGRNNREKVNEKSFFWTSYRNCYRDGHTSKEVGRISTRDSVAELEVLMAGGHDQIVS